jgi:hypothetical protein
MGSRRRIEGDAVILDGNLEYAVFVFTGDIDMMLGIIFKTVGNDVGKQLIQCQVDLESLSLGNATVLAELPEMVTELIQFRQLVF